MQNGTILETSSKGQDIIQRPCKHGNSFFLLQFPMFCVNCKCKANTNLALKLIFHI